MRPEILDVSLHHDTPVARGIFGASAAFIMSALPGGIRNPVWRSECDDGVRRATAGCWQTRGQLQSAFAYEPRVYQGSTTMAKNGAVSCTWVLKEVSHAVVVIHFVGIFPS